MGLVMLHAPLCAGVTLERPYAPRRRNMHSYILEENAKFSALQLEKKREKENQDG